MKFKLWSNIFFVIPLYISIIYNIRWYTPIIGFVVFFSTYFHYYNEKKFIKTDTFTSFLLITSNFTLLFIGNLKFPFGILSLAFGLIAIIFYLRQPKYGYDFNHGMWHIFSAITCYFSLLTFL